MNETRRTALITGANRGIGFETARQLARLGYKVIVTSRDGLQGKAAADKLQSEALDVGYHPLDVTRAESIRRVTEFLDNAFGRLDVLVNNAGVFPEIAYADTHRQSILAADPDVVRASLETNALGAMEVTRAVVPLMQRNGYGRIVNLSSGYAQLTNMGGRFVAYRMSKAAVNVLTRVFAAELADDNILVNSVDPGWVRTRMGGPNATRSAEEAAEGIVWAATLGDDGPTGGFFKAGEPIPW